MSRPFKWFLLIVGVPFALLVAVGAVLQFIEGQRTDPRIPAAEPFRDRYAAMRARLRSLAAKLPQAETQLRPESPLDPPPDYGSLVRNAEAKNTDILMQPHLLDPDSQATPVDLGLSVNLLDMLRWTGPHPPEVFKEPSLPADFGARLEAGLNTRYLAVARVTNYVPATLVDGRTYQGGHVRMQGFLMDLKTDTLRCAFAFSSAAEGMLTTSGKDQERREKGLESAARSQLCGLARMQFIEDLRNVCGGRFRDDGGPILWVC